jgi:Arc/MetJ-type ribon-helix-helix transcriptional regulator
MEIELTADQKAFARPAIATGRFQREKEIMHDALILWEMRERVRAEVLAAVDAAEVSLGHGQGRVITERSMREVAGEVKQRGRARLAAEHAAT